MPLPTATEKSEDRRRLPRYPVEDTVFITFRPRFDVVGHLVDVSDNGMAMEYTAFEPGERTGEVEVDIFCQPRKLNLAHVSCRVVYDLKLDDAPTFRGFQTRRCGLELGPLSTEEKAQLRALLTRTDYSEPLPADEASDAPLSPAARRVAI